MQHAKKPARNQAQEQQLTAIAGTEKRYSMGSLK